MQLDRAVLFNNFVHNRRGIGVGLDLQYYLLSIILLELLTDYCDY